MTARLTRLGTRVVSSRWIPWVLLAVTLVAHVVFQALGTDGFKMIDLRVYVDGTRHLSDGALYDFTSGVEKLPFTYPPFAALLFAPLGLLPWPVVAVGWQVASLAALVLMVVSSLRMLGRIGRRAERPLPHLRGTVVTATAVAFWLEPVRSTFNYGQINLFLAALLLAGASAAGRRRDVWAGLSVAVAAGIKVVPAITGLYYLLSRRWAAAAWCIAFFAGTLGVSFALLPEQTWRFFTQLMFDPSRTGAIWVTRNQSWRGTVYRLFGHDHTAAWILLSAVSLAVGIWAITRAARAGDGLAALVGTQIVGLLVSPVSWSHHWVWVVPLLLWCLFGSATHVMAVRRLGWAWAGVCLLYVVIFLIMIQNGHLEFAASRPIWESVLDAVYPVLGLAALVVIGRVHRAVPDRARD